MALGSTQPLIEMSTMNPSRVKGDQHIMLTTLLLFADSLENVGSLNSYIPLGLMAHNRKSLTYLLYLCGQ
jgi:hypothetical protein